MIAVQYRIPAKVSGWRCGAAFRLPPALAGVPELMAQHNFLDEISDGVTWPQSRPKSRVAGGCPGHDRVACCWLRVATSHPIRRRSGDRIAVDKGNFRDPARGSGAYRRAGA